MSDNLWFHGTSLYFTSWSIPEGPLKHKGGIAAHRAIFFTTDEGFARLSANGGRGLCSANISSNCKLLDMTHASKDESEKFRLKVATKNLGKRNLQVQHRQYWEDAWKTGAIMKYAPPQDEMEEMQRKAVIARECKDTVRGVEAFNELQTLTRACIEELVESARELGYDGVIGNEIDTLGISGPRKYKILFVLNDQILTPPSWTEKP